MTTLSERRQHLDFDETWEVVKWDERTEFTTALRGALHQTNDGVKAADVVGVGRRAGGARIVLVGEFKDFDHPAIPPSQRVAVARRATSDALMEDLVRKVIDTLCGATFAHDSALQRGPELSAWRPAVGSPTTELLVLFCIEVPRTQAIAVLAWTKRLQQRLRWLGSNAQVVVTTSAAAFSGSGITYSVGS